MLATQLDDQVKALLQKQAVFSILDDAELDRLLERFEMISYQMGESVLTEGEPGDAAYLVYSGKVRVFKQGAMGKPVTLGMLSAGDLFGEHALLRDTPRTASCRAAEDSVLFRLERPDFEQLVADNPDLLSSFEKLLNQNGVTRFLRMTTVLGSVPARQIVALLDQLAECSFAAGKEVFRQGDAGDCLYIIRSGEVKITLGRPGNETLLGYLGEGAYFGERALILDQPRSATVTAVKDTTCFRLARADLDRLLTEAPQLRKQLTERIEQYHMDGSAAGRLEPGPVVAVTPRRLAYESAPEKSSPPASTGPRRGRLARLLCKYPWLQQHDETDCGAASLAMISRYYGVDLSVGKLREKANVGRDGATMYSLALAAEALGYTTRAVKTDYQHLQGLNLPAVAHWKGYHYIVLYEVSGDRVIVGDPGIGLIKMSRKEFEAGWTGRLLLLTPTPKLEANERARTTFKRFLPYLAPFKLVLLEILLASLVLELLQLASPVFTQMIVDKVLVHQNVNMLNVMLVGMIFVGFFQLGTTLLRQYLLIHMSQKLSLRLNSDFFRHVLRLPMRYFNSRRLGDTLTRFADNARIQSLLTGTAISTILDCIMLLTGLGMMFYYNVRLSLVALAAYPLYIVLTLIFTPLLKRNNQKVFEKSAAGQSALVESIRSVAAIKEATAEVTTRWKYESFAAEVANITFRGNRLDMLLSGLSRSIGILAGTFMLWYGALLVIRGELTVGQLMAFQSLVGMVSAPILGFLGLWQQLQQAYRSLERLNDVYAAEPEQDPKKVPVVLPRLRGHLQLDNVCFRYNAEDKNILNGLNLEVQPGQTLAVVGRSGSGKSTLAMLLQRLYQPTEGKIRLDGHDLSTVDLRSLREQVGVVAQESTIFSGTIRENIALSDPEASLDRVVQAAKLANAHDFIQAFPLGYDTMVGEMGISLSGGQRQRLCIARALLKDPRLIIFDEATSALDTESEKAIQDNMRAILRDRTAVVIAHRLSTIQNADVIIVMDQGQIVELGNHRELLERKGLYYYLASQQLNA